MMKQQIETAELLKLFEMAQDVAHVGYWEWDIQTSEVLWSRRKIEIYGEDAEDYQPSFEKFLEVIDEETKRRVLKEIDLVLKGEKEYYDLQHKIRLRNGKTAWVHEKGFVIRTESGEPVKMVGIVYDITDKMTMLEELRVVEAQSHYLKTHDQLTALYNKQSLPEDIEKRIEAGKPFSLIFLDIDNFKSINNTFGHLFGDIVIKEVGALLQGLVECGRVYRYGGDEFVILADESCISSERLVATIESLFEKNLSILGKSLLLTMSMGVCRYPEKGSSAKDMIKNANCALALAKSGGSNRVLFYEEYMSDRVAQKRAVLDALSGALKEEEFVVHYQPKVDCRDGRVLGFEALVRWRNGEGELIPPALFLPIAQEYGMMGRIDAIVLKKALAQLQEWHREGFDVSLSVNFNMSDFEDRRILDLLKESALLPYVTIEITESELMACSEKELSLIEELKGLGLKISLDDFGTGYSSLRYIHKLPIDELKIDRGFVEQIPGNPKDEALVTIIKSIVDTFGLGCVVEGVERFEQKEFFRKLGLTTIQGYYYGRPVSSEEATGMLLKSGREIEDKSPSSPGMV